MVDIKTKHHFVSCMIQGLGGNFMLEDRSKLAEYIFNLTGERPADPQNLLLNYFDPKANSWVKYTADTGHTKI